MKISRNSWHYRFMTFMKVKPAWRHTLCDYMRGFLWAGVKTAFMGVVLTATAYVAFILLMCMGAAVWSIFQLLEPNWNDEIFIGASLWFALGVASLIFGIAIATNELPYYLDKKFPKRRCPNCKPKQPNMFVQWFKDRHSKVCRLIEFN